MCMWKQGGGGEEPRFMKQPEQADAHASEWYYTLQRVWYAASGSGLAAAACAALQQGVLCGAYLGVHVRGSMCLLGTAARPIGAACYYRCLSA
jgi:hypothetical protein